MGWWSETIMGGDTPLDCYDEIRELFGVSSDNYFSDTSHLEGFTKDLVESKLELVFDNICSEHYDGYSNYNWHVLAKIIMQTGASVPDNIKSMIITKLQQFDDTNIFVNPERRRIFIDDLIEKFKSHESGKITLLDHESLLEKFASHLKNT
jgi:hypothetical protein